MVMLHGMVLALAVFSVSSFELVSQTFNGTVSTNTSIPGVPSPPTPSLSTALIGLDMEKVSFRQDTHVVVNMHKMNITAEVKQSKIFDATTKRFTTFASNIMTGPTPSTTSSCEFYEFPNLPAPADVRKCITDVAAAAKPVGSEGGLQKFEFGMPVDMKGTKSVVADVIYMDASFVVKKMINDMNITSPINCTTHTEIVDLNSKAGAPDSSFFTIPSEWGTCHKAVLPSMPTPDSAILRDLRKCLGMGPTQPPIAPILV